ncbi:MAG: dephospho-CoA kinase [Clostridia bacterium]|nr:dephospho-CoA kinase [Clostridia bacterium]
MVKIGMMQNNIKIAITGGIGSGKSSVAQLIRELGYTVLSCDEIYSELLQNNNFLSVLEKEFGGVIADDGSLDRCKLSELVFNNKDALTKLNSITHPAIMKEVFSKLQRERIGFCEVPLLFENGFEKLFDEVIVVLRDESERIKSVSLRDGLDLECIKKRLYVQIDYQNYTFTKYYVIHNDGNLSELSAKTAEIIKKLEKKYF